MKENILPKNKCICRKIAAGPLSCGRIHPVARKGGITASEIELFLCRLGITKRYKGYRRIMLILQLVLEDEDRLEAITKELYMEAASTLNCGWKAVEHSLRTVIKRAWDIDPDFLAELVGYRLTECPTNAEFLSMSAGYLRHRSDLGVKS